MKINNPNAGFRGMTFQKSLEMFDPYYKKTNSNQMMISNQRMIDVLMELSKYRLLSKDEIEELVILRKAQDR